METNRVQTEKEPLKVARKKKKRAGAFSKALNRYFHHLDRGGTLGGEVLAGLTVFLLSICLIFVNVQLVGAAVVGDITPATTPANAQNIADSLTYAQLYAGSILVAFLGTLLIGLVARLPFAQLSTMGLSSALISLVSSGTGLTYSNLLFLNLVAAVLYAVLTAVPKLKDWVYRALPAGLRKALPAAAGLILVLTALQLSGFVTTTTVSQGTLGGLSGLSFGGIAEFTSGSAVGMAFIGAVAAIVVYSFLKGYRAKHPALFSLLIGTLVFVGINAIRVGFVAADTESYINFGRIWLVAGSQSSDATPFADSYLTYFSSAISAVLSNLGSVLTEGSDFSAYTGDTVALAVGSVLCYLFLGLYHTDAVVEAAKEQLNARTKEENTVDLDGAKGRSLVYWCNAGINIIAPFFGVGAVAVSDTSVAGAEDDGKSGLTSIVAAIGLLISLFIFAFPFLLATGAYPVNSMNQWNYFAYGNGGFLYLVQGVSFGIADAVLACVGVSMCRSLKNLDYTNQSQWLPAMAMVAVSLFTLNLVTGVAVGVVLYCAAKVAAFHKRGDKLGSALKIRFVPNLKELGVPTIVLCVLMIAYLALMI